MSPPSIEPPRNRTDNPVPWQRRWVTYGLWFFAFFAFLIVQVAFDVLLIPDRTSAAIVGAALVVPIFLWTVYRTRRGHRQNDEGIIALQDGRLADAKRIFAATAQRFRRVDAVAPLATYNLATVHQTTGRLADAEAELARVERWRKLAYASQLRVMAAISLAELFALRGNVDLARRWFVEAKARLDASSLAVHHRGALAIAELTVLARGDDPAQAVAAYESSQALLNGSEPLARMRVAWLLHAFATWRLTGPRDQGHVAILLRKLQGDKPGAFAHVYAEWPELETFVETHLDIVSA